MTRAVRRPVALSIRRRLEQAVRGLGGPTTLANKLATSDECVRHWLAGRNLPSADMLIALGKLGVSPDWLLFGTGKVPSLPYDQPKKGT
jgi:hypothetical protein